MTPVHRTRFKVSRRVKIAPGEWTDVESMATIELCIDLEAVARSLGYKAARNKSKRSHILMGLVTAHCVKLD